MADVKYYQEAIEKAGAKVEKCKGTIERHQKALEKKIAIVVKLGIDPERLDDFKWYKVKGSGSEFCWEICEVEGKQRDIEGAKKKLKEAEQILKNWQDKLAVEINREKFIENEAPSVIKEFLEQWKVLATDWHIKRYEKYLKLREKLAKEQRKAYKELGISETTFPRGEQRKELEKRGLDYNSIKSKLNAYAGPIVLRMEMEGRNRLTYLEKTLEQEKKNKLLELIYRIKDAVGEITDAKGLYISEVGNLNGIVTGTKGKAKVEMIGEGGYNIQCFHYRTLVNRINK